MDPCDPNAACMDIDGSFDCSCDDGYEGNGFNCSSESMQWDYHYQWLSNILDIDECDAEPCDVNAGCEDTEGSFICSCNSGFIGDGFSCSSKLTCSVVTKSALNHFLMAATSYAHLHAAVVK